jgi:hypothetical protein
MNIGHPLLKIISVVIRMQSDIVASLKCNNSRIIDFYAFYHQMNMHLKLTRFHICWYSAHAPNGIIYVQICQSEWLYRWSMSDVTG